MTENILAKPQFIIFLGWAKIIYEGFYFDLNTGHVVHELYE